MHDKVVIVAGVQKSGTSSLYRLLSTHPEIAPSRRTETEFFTFPFEPEGAAQRYARFFPDEPDKWWLDVSPGYFVSPEAPRQIAEVTGTPRILIIAREPVARAYSAWKMQQTKGSDLYPFEESVRRTSHYLEHGRYATHAQRFIDRFGSENVQFLLFDDLKRQPAAVTSALAKFLSIAPFEKNEVPSENVGGLPRSRAVVGALSRFYRGREKLRKAGLGGIVDHPTIDRFSRRLRNRVADWNRDPQAADPGPSDAARSYIIEELAPEIDRFERMIGSDLSDWRMSA